MKSIAKLSRNFYTAILNPFFQSLFKAVISQKPRLQHTFGDPFRSLAKPDQGKSKPTSERPQSGGLAERSDHGTFWRARRRKVKLGPSVLVTEHVACVMPV